MASKILVIEDNDQNLYLVTYILEKKRYEVLQAHDGREGIEIAGKTSLNLILLDIQLPLMDGYSVAKILKKNMGGNDIPIIAITSYAMAGDREKAFEAGCSGYITKPIDPDTFISNIEHYLFST